MTNATDEGFHEIQLNGKQLVFLFMALTVASVVIFLLGVLVGRGVRVERTLADPLSAPEAVAAAPAPDAPAAAVSSGGPPAAANEDLSYPNRLASGGEVPREHLRSTPPPPTPQAPPAERARTDAAPATSSPEQPTAAEPSGAGFAIQLAALRQREEAEAVARRLTGKGYPAYVLTPGAGAPPVFRVRVGKFKDRREAESVAARLQKEEQFNPWIVH